MEEVSKGLRLLGASGASSLGSQEKLKARVLKEGALKAKPALSHRRKSRRRPAASQAALVFTDSDGAMPGTR
jgi:hypothetical protein